VVAVAIAYFVDTDCNIEDHMHSVAIVVGVEDLVAVVVVAIEHWVDIVVVVVDSFVVVVVDIVVLVEDDRNQELVDIHRLDASLDKLEDEVEVEVVVVVDAAEVEVVVVLAAFVA